MCDSETTLWRGDGLEVEAMSRNPEGRSSIPRLVSRRSSLISIEHAELLLSTPSLVLCCAWLVTMALHVHCGLGQLSPLPTSGDDKWVAAKHCGRAKRSRISDTHRLRSSLQFRYINNQSLLYSRVIQGPFMSDSETTPVWSRDHSCVIQGPFMCDSETAPVGFTDRSRIIPGPCTAMWFGDHSGQSSVIQEPFQCASKYFHRILL